jgi:hypothetical protein
MLRSSSEGSGDLSRVAGLKRALAAQKKGNLALLGARGVTGTAARVDENGSPELTVYVTDKTDAIPEQIDGVPVSTEVTGRFSTLDEVAPHRMAKATARPGTSTFETTVRSSATCQTVIRGAKANRPVPIGVSSGTEGTGGGTYGVRLRDAMGNLYMLSNNHVYAGRNLAPIGSRAVQPNITDGGRAPDDTVGRLASFEPLRFYMASPDGTPLEAPATNIMDAAVVATTADEAGNSTPCDGYGTPSRVALAPTVGMRVKKYGRASGLTEGVIVAVNASVDIPYARLSNGNFTVARFDGQILVKVPGFCEGGDSGSLVVTEAGNPVGLLFAGNSFGGSYCVVSPILPILARFAMTVDGV